MIALNFLVGILAGIALPHFERWFRDFSESVWLGGLPLTEQEFERVALLLMVMIAAIVVGALGFESSAFMMAFGFLVGLFFKRLWRRIRLETEA